MRGEEGREVTLRKMNREAAMWVIIENSFG